jgi:NAD(P)-dependent dehydrogenase (short-subunit alcohol dehydrogenase family)
MSAPRKVAVLGGAGGIGQAMVAALMARGDGVAVLDLPASMAAHPQDCPSIPIDITDPGAVARAMADLGRLWPEGADGFVNLAGWSGRIAPMAALSDEEWESILDGNLKGAVRSTRAMLPLMREGGAVVLAASGLAQFIRPDFGPYAMAKAGVIALTKTLALECAPKLRVNAVGPAAVDTAFLRGGAGRGADPDAPRSVDPAVIAAMTPLGRMATADDVVGPMMFLLGGGASFMTGQVLWINGGTYMP